MVVGECCSCRFCGGRFVLLMVMLVMWLVMWLLLMLKVSEVLMLEFGCVKYSGWFVCSRCDVGVYLLLLI